MANGIAINTGGFDLGSFDAALKIIYSKQAVVDETYKNRPFHGLIPKETDFTGRQFVQDVITSLPQGRSSTFANAQTNKSSLGLSQFTIVRGYDFALASVDLWTLFASEGDKGAMLDAMTSAVNGARGSLMRSAAIAEFRDGTGDLGTISAVTTGASGTATMTVATDVTNFELNQVVNFYSNTNFSAGTATQRTGAVSVSTVTAIDRVAGVVTFNSVPTDAIAGDHIVADGDYGNQTIAGVSAPNKIVGLAGWLPYGGPTATSFFGLDRTKDKVRLAGWSSNQIGKAEDEALLNCSYEIFMYGGGSPDHAFISPNRFNNVAKLLGPQRRYVGVKATSGAIGYDALEIMGQGRTIKVLADPNCPDNRGYMLTLDEWQLKTLGAMPRFLNPNSKTLTEATANRVEIRCGYAGNMFTKAPGHSGVLAFA